MQAAAPDPGWASGSRGVFLIALVALLVAAHYAGDIRRGLPAVQLPARALCLYQAGARAGCLALPTANTTIQLSFYSSGEGKWHLSTDPVCAWPAGPAPPLRLGCAGLPVTHPIPRSLRGFWTVWTVWTVFVRRVPPAWRAIP